MNRIQIQNYFRKIDRYPIISFDIFDTLIERVYSSPSAIFKVMENNPLVRNTGVVNFAGLRRQAEKDARAEAEEAGNEEIGLADIYKFVGRYCGLAQDLLDRLMALEIATETAALREARMGRLMYDYALKLNKRVILTSDMYLSRETVISFLKKNDFLDYDRLYLSSDYNKTKRTGTLFKLVLEDLAVPASDILHIGDNPLGDFSVPEGLGITTLRILRPGDRMENDYTFTRKIKEQLSQSMTLERSYVLREIQSSIFDLKLSERKCFDNPWHFGSAMLGPLVLGAVTWIKRECEKDNIDKILFLSRDGKVFKEAFDVLYPDEIPTEYVYSSRRAASVASFANEWDIQRVLNKRYYTQTLHHYLSYNFGLTAEDLESLPDCDISGNTDPAILRETVMSYKDTILEHSRLQHRYYLDYLKKRVGNARNLAVVDIGYAGTMQKSISVLLGKKVKGYYLATDVSLLENGLTGEDAKGYLSDLTPNKEQDPLGINKNRFFYEAIICSEENSFLGFTPEGEFLFSDFEDPFRKKFVRLAHEGAVDYCRKFAEFWDRSVPFSLSGRDACCALDNFLDYPVPQDLVLFDNIEFEDQVAPALKRVMLTREPRAGVREIWVKGAEMLHNMQENIARKKALDAEAAAAAKKNAHKVEKWLLRKFLSQKKFEKYSRDRKAFFLDSRSGVVKAYAKMRGIKP